MEIQGDCIKGMLMRRHWVPSSMDQVFHDLIRECESIPPGAQLTYSLKKHLEHYKIELRKEIVSRVKNGCAPLFIACRRGHVEVVTYLITVCQADIEQKGRYEVPDDHSVHYVTPLWCAAVSGKLPVIKCLISHGADVNAVSDSGSTPVRSACFMTHMDIVTYLVEHGADILKANYNGGTCLINSVQSVELCGLLLHHGADVNATDIQNKTALHYAIQEHRLQTTELLLKFNADPHLRSRHNDDALQTACLKGAVEIFEYLVEKVPYSPERLADAHELMGSTCFDDHRDIQNALVYWGEGIVIRNVNAVNYVPLPKRPVLSKCEAFRNATEFTTFNELSAIALDLDAMRIQSLLICERILGPYHKDTLFRLILRGASYADAFRYQNCIDLWRRVLKIRAERDSILHVDTCFIAQPLLRIMLDFNVKSLKTGPHNRDEEKLRFRDVVEIFMLLSGQLIEARELLEKRPVYKKQRESYERVLSCVTHLIYLLIETAKAEEEKSLTRYLVHRLVKQTPRSVYTENTLLHLCVSNLNIISCTNFNAITTFHMIFPDLEVVKVLLECGAQVNARNVWGSTPLHIASDRSNFQTPLIKLLLEYGAHLDTPNKAGDTSLKLISSNPLNNINPLSHMNLQCLAAQTIRKYGIRCTDLPATLHHFLDLHKE